MIAYLLSGYMAWGPHKMLGVFASFEEVLVESRNPKHRNWDYLYYDKWEDTHEMESKFFAKNGVWLANPEDK